MSNETDLAWLARNVHVWREGANYVCVNHTDGGYVFHEHNRNCAIWFTKDQWLARRAELQNKPSWEDAPEWAEWLAQDEDGEWKWLAGLPVKYVDGWAAVKIKGHCKGLALDDWRDTLEKRPEQTIADICREVTGENRHEEIFEPFVSVDDSLEKEMKQDNGWHERGELPPVGTECEIDLGAKWRKAFVVGRNYTGRIVVEIDTCDFIVADGCTFRPIRTERDVLIEIIKKTDDTDDKIADAILAAGFSLRDK